VGDAIFSGIDSFSTCDPTRSVAQGPCGGGGDLEELFLIGKITNELKALGLSNAEIEKALSHPNMVAEFRAFYEAAASGGDVRMEVVRANGEISIGLIVYGESEICIPVVKFDMWSQSCAMEPYEAFNDRFSIPDELEMKRRELAEKRSPKRPTVARSNKAKPDTTISSLPNAVGPAGHELLKDDGLATLEQMNQRRFDYAIDDFNGMPVAKIGPDLKRFSRGCNSGRCEPDPFCYVNGDVKGEPRWDYVRAGICKFCGS
jgi:hypothetical protein